MNLQEMLSFYTEEILQEVTEARRELHQCPELSLEEVNTQKRIMKFLKDHEIEGDDTQYATSVVALIKGKLPGKCVALRADMDALPVTEGQEFPWKSKNEGICHACGHDFHMAILLGAAAVLNKMKDQLNGQVKIIFQPSEEQAHRGGARFFMEKGILENPHVDAIFAAHVWPDLEIGQIGICRKEMMSCCDVVNVTLYGKGGHISMPHKSINPIYPAVQFVNALANLRTQRFDPFADMIIDLGKFQAGFINTGIPDKAELGISVRAYDNTVRYKIKSSIEDILSGLASMYGITYDLDYNMSLPVLNNDEKMGEFYRQCAADVVGKENVLIPNPVMSAEDFGWYLEEVPGAFAWLGIAEGDSCRASLHNPMFAGNEKCLKTGIELFANTAVRFLNES